MTDHKLTVDDLSDDQRMVYESMLDWCGENRGSHFDGSDANLLTIGGLAGTGKTTLLGIFAATTDLRVAYVSFTGRAASVLQRKLRAAGCQSDVTTIHRLLYLPVVDTKTEEILGWKKRTKMPEYDLVVIDEASMVSGNMLDDLRALGRPIMAVGDHGQLPPVMDSGDLMKTPDLRLEKIHRQAFDNPIIQLAHNVRSGERLRAKRFDDRITFRRRDDAAAVIAQALSMTTPLDVGILCWTNKMRVKLNAHARNAMGFKGCPNEGEVVMCLKNAPPIYNGMRGVLRSSGRLDGFKVFSSIEFPEEGLSAAPTEMYAGQFNREKTIGSLDELKARGVDVSSLKAAGMLFDFGYSLTVHRSQGSSFKHVVWYLDREENPSSQEWVRFAYTAISRASERLTILC